VGTVEVWGWGNEGPDFEIIRKKYKNEDTP
jgi:hypothetical protein